MGEGGLSNCPVTVMVSARMCSQEGAFERKAIKLIRCCSSSQDDEWSIKPDNLPTPSHSIGAQQRGEEARSDIVTQSHAYAPERGAR